MVFEKPIDLAIHEEVGAPEIQELLPLGVAVADHPGVRPTVEGVCRINHGGPALVTLGEQQHVAIAADPGVGALARTGSAPSVIRPWRAKTPASFNVSADESGALSASGCSGPPSPRGIALTAVRHCHWRTALRPYGRQNKQDPLPHGQVSPCRSFRPLVSLALAQHC